MSRRYFDIGLPNWVLSPYGRFDPIGAQLADRHYSRRSQGARQFMPPGEVSVLILRPSGSAVFGWSYQRYATHGFDAWVCTIFRNESELLSSELILEAEKASYIPNWGRKKCYWIRALEPRPDGFITFVDCNKVSSPNPGYCFKKAGWRKKGFTQSGLLILQKPWERKGQP